MNTLECLLRNISIVSKVNRPHEFLGRVATQYNRLHNVWVHLTQLLFLLFGLLKKTKCFSVLFISAVVALIFHHFYIVARFYTKINSDSFESNTVLSIKTPSKYVHPHIKKTLYVL